MMCPHCETRRAMRFSRGMRLGAIVTTVRHLILGGCALSLGTLAVTGHGVFAIGIVVAIYLLSKAAGWAWAHLPRKGHPCP